MTSVLKFSKAHWSEYRCEYHAFDLRQWLIWKPTLIEGSVYVEHPLLLDSHLEWRLREIVCHWKVFLTCICSTNDEVEFQCVFLREVFLTRVNDLRRAHLKVSKQSMGHTLTFLASAAFLGE